MYAIIALVILAFIGLLLLCKKSFTEKYGDKPGNPVEGHPHGVKTGQFPKLPREIDSQYHHDSVKTRLAGLDKCGKCQELEQKLVQDGKQALSQLEKSRYIKQDLQTKYKSYTHCEMCRMLLQTWDRYFDILGAMSDYIYDKKLPAEPKMVKTGCSGCDDIQRKDKEYADNLTKELECRVKAAQIRKANGQALYCQHVKIPRTGYNAKKDCKECEEMYNKWQKYIFTIVALINYYRFGKQV